MKKLALNVDELRVDSFDTASIPDVRGTVNGHYTIDTTCVQTCTTCQNSCRGTCDWSCQGSCDNTCQYTCNLTCPYTCGFSCFGSCGASCVATCNC